MTVGLGPTAERRTVPHFPNRGTTTTRATTTTPSNNNPEQQQPRTTTTTPNNNNNHEQQQQPRTGYELAGRNSQIANHFCLIANHFLQNFMELRINLCKI